MGKSNSTSLCRSLPSSVNRKVGLDIFADDDRLAYGDGSLVGSLATLTGIPITLLFARPFLVVTPYCYSRRNLGT